MRRDLPGRDDEAYGGLPAGGSVDVPPPGPRPVVVTLLGGLSLGRDGRTMAVASRKAQALLGVLALGTPSAASRERLCGLLWSEFGEDKARASLRQVLHTLKGGLEEHGWDILEAGRESVALSGSWTSDVADILARLELGEVDDRLLGRTGLGDTLLCGLEDVDPSFRVWLLVQRQAIGEELARALTRVLDTGTPDRARDAAAALLNLDPTHEEACRHAMRDAAERGDISSALRTYKRLWDLLDEEYGTEPSEQTQELVVRIKNNELSARTAPRATELSAASEAAPAASRVDDHPYLIVAAFDGGGVGGRFAHLVGGLRHALIAKLVRFREWSVVDGGGPHLDIESLPGRRVSIEATLREAGANLSLTVTTKEQPSGLYLWSEDFTLALEHWFELELSLVRQIAMSVNVQLTAARLSHIVTAPEVSSGHYERWLRGQQLVLSFGSGDWERAEGLFQSLVDEAPASSPAHSGLVQLENTRDLVFPGFGRTPERSRRALGLATNAVRIDPFDSRGHLAKGWALAFERDWEPAELAVDLALRLNDNDPWTLTSSALLKAFCGKHDAAVELAEQSLALMPQPPPVHWAYQATLRFVCADYAGSADAAERAMGVISNLHGWHAAALAHLGEENRAAERARFFLATIRTRWQGECPTEHSIVEWFLCAFPIRADADRARLRDGLLQALS